MRLEAIQTFFLGPGLLRGACHRAALRADPVARNDGRASARGARHWARGRAIRRLAMTPAAIKPLRKAYGRTSTHRLDQAAAMR